MKGSATSRRTLRRCASNILRRLAGSLACGEAQVRPVAWVDPLEDRRLLSLAPMITEFMASNTQTLTVDGQTPDWVEIYNPAPFAVNMAGWHLTDDAGDPDKWTFPSVNIPASGYLLVYLSDVIPSNPTGVWASFELSAGGEYLGLVDPAGNVVQSFDFPSQREDYSYGVTTAINRETLIGAAGSAVVLVPHDGSLGATWTGEEPQFDDSAWRAGVNGIGYETDNSGARTGGFTVRMVDTNGGTDGVISDIGEAIRILDGTAGGAFINSFSGSKNEPVVNYGDGGSFASPRALPSGATSGQHYALRVTADVLIPQGVWSLRINSDDGFLLTMPGVQFYNRINENYTGTSYTPATVPSDTIAYGGIRGTSTSSVTFSAPAGGIYTRMQLDYFQGAGGQGLELAVGSGENPASLSLLGDTVSGWSVWAASADAAISYAPLISPTLDLRADMYRSYTSAYIRMPFGLESAADFDTLILNMRYDDGFVAYVNGHRVASRNAPADPQWNSTAGGDRADALCIVREQIPISAIQPDGTSILRDDENILAIHLLNLSRTSTDLLAYAELEATELVVRSQRYYQAPTPGGANNDSGPAQQVADTTFTHDRGFYENPFYLEIATATEGAVIRYTLDGTEPTMTSGYAYDRPLFIERTTTVRAAAFLAGYLSTNADTHTYIFPEDVLRQAPTGAAPEGWPGSWGSNTVDYGMDASVTAPSPTIAVIGPTAVFASVEEFGTGGYYGLEPWATNGSGAFRLRDIVGGYGSSGASGFVAHKGIVYFRAADSAGNYELWRSDGTAGGTYILRDIRSGGGSYPSSLTSSGNYLYFAASDGGTGYELWRTDGTSNGTVLVRDIASGSASSYPSRLTDVNGTLYFTCYTSNSGWELWKSNGTSAGTGLVREIRAGSASADPANLTNVNGTLFFTAYDDAAGNELWKSDGTSGGTVRVRDIHVGRDRFNKPYGSSPRQLFNANGTLLFTAFHPDSGSELWRSDGTEEGTYLVRDIRYGTDSSNIRSLVMSSGRAWFSANDGVTGRELWTTDGTAEGTQLVADIRPGGKDSDPEELADVNGVLFFAADDGDSGTELWKVAAGAPAMVKDIAPGETSSHPRGLTALNGQLIFSVDAATGQPRLWRSNGDASQTVAIGLAEIHRTSSAVAEDLESIPSFSVVMKLDDLFNASTGIYANPSQSGKAWERKTSLELIFADESEGFQADAGIRVRGGFSRSTDNPKHGFRFFFRGEYGDAKLNYPVFGDDATDSFDSFDLRTFQNYSWSYGGAENGIFVRDLSSRDLQLATGNDAERGDYFHLFINGVYWGLYNSCERPEASYAASYYGGSKEDYDVVKVGGQYHVTGATDGDMTAWTTMWNMVRGDMTNMANYQKVLGNNPDGTRNPAYPIYIDADNLIDYMLVIFYGGNLDAPLSNFLGNSGPNNYYAIRNRNGQQGFQFFTHDAEHTLLNASEDRTGPYNTYSTVGNSNPQYVFQLLCANPEFRLRVADRIQKHFFGDGALTPAAVTGTLLARYGEMYDAVALEAARWGDSKREPPRTRDNEWMTEFARVITAYVPQRTTTVLNQLRGDSLFPSLPAPAASVVQGAIRISGSGELFYTTNGADPRLVGGGLSPSAQRFITPIPVVGAITLKARARSGSTWSPLTEITFVPDFAGLRITEINYNPADGADTEFIELRNISSAAIALRGLQFDKGITAVLDSVSLAPQAYGLIVRNRAAFEAAYGTGLPIVGVFGETSPGDVSSLSNGGEKLRVVAANGDTVMEFAYSDEWYTLTDGDGFTLVLRDPATPVASLGDPAAWRGSFNIGGSPGAADPGIDPGAVVISELVSNSDQPAGDWVELYNATDAPISLAGWFISDNEQELTRWAIPAGVVIPAHDYLVFTETGHFGAAFEFAQEGERVFLTSPDAAGGAGGYRESRRFRASESDVSFGRHVNSVGDVDFVELSAPTPGYANAEPVLPSVVISEIMYNPQASQEDEFIELKNMTEEAIVLHDPSNPATAWKFTDGIDFTFPPGATLAPGGFGLVVRSDPDAFRLKYRINASIPVWGPYADDEDPLAADALANGGEDIELSRPLLGLPIEAGILVDRVRYDDDPPWPVQADGGGPSLVRWPLASFGNEPANWNAGPVGGTPGGDPGLYEGAGGDDLVRIQLDATRAFVEFYAGLYSTEPALSVPRGQIGRLVVSLKGGDDELIIDLVNGNPLPSGGIEFLGGAGANRLGVRGGGGADNISAAAGRIYCGGYGIDFADIAEVAIDGGGGDDTLGIAFDAGYAPVLQGGDGNDTILLAGTAGDDAVVLDAAGASWAGGAAGLAGIETFNFDGGDGADTLAIRGGPPVRAVFAAGLGDDVMVFEDALSTNATFDAGGGRDLLEIPGTAGDDVFTIQNNRIELGGFAVQHSGLDQPVIRAGAGDDRLVVATVLVGSLSFDGGDGTDAVELAGSTAGDIVWITDAVINVNAGAYNLEQVEAASVNPGAGGDTININVRALAVAVDGGPTGDFDRIIIAGSAENEHYAIGNGVGAINGAPFSWQSIDQMEIEAGAGDDVLTYTAVPAILPIFRSGDGDDLIDIQGGAFRFGYDLKLLDPVIGVRVAGPGAVARFDATQHLSRLEIAAGGLAELTASGARVLRPGALSIDGGTLDLYDNALLLGGGDAAELAGWLSVGRIRSTTGASTKGVMDLVLLENDNGAGQAITGQVNAEPALTGDLVVKYTKAGDVDVNGRVDGDDYFLTDQGFLAAGPPNGDLTHDGAIDGDDYLVLDYAYLAGAIAPAAQPAPAALFATGAPLALEATSPSTELLAEPDDVLG